MNAVSATSDERTATLQQAELALFEGRHADAGALLQQAAAREPLNASLWHEAAKLLLRFGRTAEACAAASMAALLEPDDLEKRLLLAESLCCTGDSARALAEYQVASLLDAGDPRIRQGLERLPGTVGARKATDPAAAALARGLLAEAQRLASAAQPEQALNVLMRCAQLLPGTAMIHYRIACLLQDSGRLEWALAHYELAARLQPDLFRAVHNAGKIAAGFGLAARALPHLSSAHRLRPQDGITMRLELLTEAIHASQEALLESRARFEAGIERLLEAPPRIADPLNKMDLPTFYLAYHGVCNRQLHCKLARAFMLATPELDWRAPHCLGAQRRPGRIRVGFISQFLRNHSIGKVARGLVAQLSREHFEVYVLNIPPLVLDDTARWIREHGDRCLTVADDLSAARSQIAALELDILFYQDIGMEPFSYLLALARLAPVQCVSYGHPDTTGIPTMDYYISNDLYETPDAADHYSERLAELHGLPTLAYYFRPPVPHPLPTRADLGLPPARVPLYLCPQSLFKLHPDFDGLVQRILERDGVGRVLLFAGECSDWSLMLRRRFKRVMPEVAGRIQFLPRQPYASFLQLLSVADVVLDTVHFNGMNTSIDAFSVGTPVVTLPTSLQRGRFTQAMYRTMEIHDGIAADAEEYADLAVSIATNPDRRRDLHGRILERSNSLFENRRAVAEFERFFHRAHESALRER